MIKSFYLKEAKDTTFNQSDLSSLLKGCMVILIASFVIQTLKPFFMCLETARLLNPFVLGCSEILIASFMIQTLKPFYVLRDYQIVKSFCTGAGCSYFIDSFFSSILEVRLQTNACNHSLLNNRLIQWSTFLFIWNLVASDTKK